MLKISLLFIYMYIFFISVTRRGWGRTLLIHLTSSSYLLTFTYYLCNNYSRYSNKFNIYFYWLNVIKSWLNHDDTEIRLSSFLHIYMKNQKSFPPPHYILYTTKMYITCYSIHLTNLSEEILFYFLYKQIYLNNCKALYLL